MRFLDYLFYLAITDPVRLGEGMIQFIDAGVMGEIISAVENGEEFEE